MITTPALSITKAASKQTYYTIRFLVDRARVDDAYRAYAYFRWVDDILDADGDPAAGRPQFLARQQWLLEECLEGRAPRGTNVQEDLLVELVAHDREKSRGLRV